MSYKSKGQEQDAIEFMRLMGDAQCEAWLKSRVIIQKKLSQSADLPNLFQREIVSNLKKVNNLLMLIYIYSLNLQYKSSDYGSQFEKIRDQNNYSLILSWLDSQNQQNQQLTIELILQSFSQFLNKRMPPMMSNMQLIFFLRCFSLFDIKRQRNIDIVMRFVNNIKQIRLLERDQMWSKQIAIIKYICAIEADQKSRGNMGLLFDQILIGQTNDNNIERFCNFYDVYLCEFTAQQLLRIFSAICKSGINNLIVTLILKICRVLASSQQYFKLKFLYQQFILPTLIKHCKSCQKENVSQTIQKIAECFVIGFLAYCDIGQLGIEYLLSNVEFVRFERYKKRWVELAYMAAQRPNKQEYVDKILTNKKMDKYISDGRLGKNNLSKNEPWEITTRNIRQHKAYKKQDSPYCGIKNKSIQCYIISSVQALFMTKNLQGLLKKSSKKKSRVIDALSSIFELLSAQNSKNIKIDNVQEKGPKQFRQSQRQQDAYQYLMALMTQIQKEVRQENLFEEFKKCFEIELKTTVSCQKCKRSQDSIQRTYIHTISNNEKIKIQSEEYLTDFNCEKCRTANCKKNLKLNLNSKIFIVHINRFSVSKGVAKKQLPTEKIIRKIENYSLVGIIFHIGKSVECGHYVYYSKISSKRWVEFNDDTVKEFNLQKEDEQFERETKAEKTPYILFYKREE